MEGSGALQIITDPDLRGPKTNGSYRSGALDIKWHKKGNGNGGKLKRKNKIQYLHRGGKYIIQTLGVQQDPDCTQPDNPSNIRY